jgi:hypothetical protein
LVRDDVKQAYERVVKHGYIEMREKGKPIQHLPVGGVGGEDADQRS